MKIVFREDTAQDIEWFRHYDRSVFPDGSAKAGPHIKAIQKTLAANPYVGHPSDAQEKVRELSIPRTPFTPTYRVAPAGIEILRLWDSRQGTGY